MTAPEPTPTPTPEPTPSPTPTPTPPAQGWMDQAELSADLKAHPTMAKFAQAGSVAEAARSISKSYIELEKTLGAERIALPKSDAPPEEWAEFHRKTGCPEKIDGYGLSEWKPPEGLPWDEKLASKMIERFHVHGLTTRQAQGVLNDFAQAQKESWNEMVQSMASDEEASLETLRKEWGSAYKPKVAAAKKAVVQFAGSDLLDEILTADGQQLGSDARVIRLFAAVGEALGEDSGPGPAAGALTMTPDEADAKLRELLADEDKLKILMDSNHPQHKALQEYRTSLEKQRWASEE